MLQVKCSGSPYEIGQQHGEQAKDLVKGSIAFYEAFFKKKTNKSWHEIESVARDFLPYLQMNWPFYLEEMTGLANGAGVPFESILALNVRTEIAYGMQMDGCTAIAWKTKSQSFLAQNWDWDAEQSQNIICLHIVKDDSPRMHFMTEAGIIGKIGLNSAGVGVTLNAIYARGVNFNKLPCHLALRTVLESTSVADARKTLLNSGVAAACHVTIADSQGPGVGLECTSEDIVELEAENGICTHSNHLVKPHKIKDHLDLKDTLFRIKRIQELSGNLETEPTVRDLQQMLKDEKNLPGAICRQQTEKSTIQTLFSIVMDLNEKTAHVKMGRPTENGEELTLRP